MFILFLQTTIALFVLLQMASSVVLMTDGSPDEAIYNELISRKRPILAIGKLAHSSQVVLLAGQLNKPDDIYVYEIPVAETTSISKLALSGGELLSNKWPVIYDELTKATSVVLVSDTVHDYFMTIRPTVTDDSGFFAAYNIKYANVATWTMSAARYDFKMVSSTDVLSSFGMQPNEQYLRRFHYMYSRTINTKQVFLPNTTKMFQIGGPMLFCLSTTALMITFNDLSCPHDATACSWNIISGFVDDHQITLFDLYGSVYMFPRSSLDADLSVPVKLAKAQLSDYFVLSKNGPTIAPHKSNVSLYPVNTESDRSNIGFIVVIAILVIVLLLGIVIYFVNSCKTLSKKERANKAAILDSPKDGNGKATDKNGQAPKESAKPKAKDKTSAKACKQTGKPAGRSEKRTPKTGHKGSGPHGSRSKQSSKAKTDRTGGHRSAAPSANSSQVDSAMSAQSQPQNKSSSASSAPKKGSRSGARKAKRSSGNSSHSSRKSLSKRN